MKKIQILLADDNAQWREPMKTMLESRGLSVAVAKDGAAAVEKAQSLVPDLIILDHKMPKMTGQEAAKKIRMNPQTKNIPIIMVSAMDMKRSTIEYIKLDVNDFLKKPFTSDVLVRQIEEMTGQPVGRDEDLSPQALKKAKIIIALEKNDSVSRIKFVFGKDTTMIKAKDTRQVIEHIKKDSPELVVVNYKTAGLGTAEGLKLLYAALLRKTPLLLDMVDVLKPQAAGELMKKKRRYYLLEPDRGEETEKKIKSILGKLELF